MPTYRRANLVGTNRVEICKTSKMVKIYPAGLKWSQTKKRWVWTYNKEKQVTFFDLDTAIIYRNKYAKTKDLIQIRDATLYELGEVSPQMEQYFAGFIDGDGSIFITEGRLRVSISQSSNNGIPEILGLLQKNYGGSMASQKRKSEDKQHHKTEYSLLFCGEDTLPLLQLVEKYGIQKQPQAVLALEYLLLTSQKRIPDVKMRRQDIILEVKKLKDEYHHVQINSTKLTIAYIAGLFDAEGCVLVDAIYSLYITQHSNLQLLQEIKLVLKAGHVRPGQLVIQKKTDILRITNLLLPFSTMKKTQLLEMKKILLIKHVKKADKKATCTILKELKKF